MESKATVNRKSRSRYNASTHQIFAKRVLPHEEKLAASFYSAYQRDLQSEGTLEQQLIGDLVMNRLRKHRIDQYEAHQFTMARIRFDKEREDRLDRREARGTLLVAVPRQMRGVGEHDRMPPGHCISMLRVLKDGVQRNGPRFDALRMLERI
jgi:hypothetical protein